MKRRGLAFCAGLLLLGLLPGSALALATVDQKNETANHDTTWSGIWLAQTFKAGHTGSMTGVDLRLFTSSGTTVIALDIQRVDGSGHPDGTTVVGTSLVVGTTDNWVHFTFQPTSVTAGQRYAIVFHAALSCHVRYSDANAYPDGQALYRPSSDWLPSQLDPNRDFAFRTWMNLPLPMTLLPSATPPATPTAAATPTPAATPTAAATPAPVSTSSLAPGSTPTPTLAPSESPTASEPPATGPSATETSVVTAVPAPGSGSSGGGGGSSDLTLPIVAAAIAVMAGLAAGLLLVLLRRRRRAAGE